MKLAYQAMDKSGRIVSDVIDAPDMLEATDLLRRQGLFVTTLRESSGARPAPRGSATPRRGGGPRQLKLVAMFTRQLSVLVGTGTPLVQAIAALEKQARDDRWRGVVSDLRRRLEDGESFCRALEDHPRHFDPVYRSLVEAGESSGHLHEMLSRLARLTRQRLHVRNIIAGAMMYPSILVVVALAVLSVMIGFVLPRFTGLFQTLDAPLPPSTQFLLSISEVIRGRWMFIVPSLAVLALGVWTAWRRGMGHEALDRAALRLPIFGCIVRNFATARVTRLLGTLLESKVPLLESLRLTREGSTSAPYRALMQQCEDAVTRGENLSAVLARSELIDATIAEAVRCGEQTGQMGSVLVNVSDFLEEENEVVVKSLSSIIEPVILIVLGVLVGIVAVSMFMPLFDITATVPGGGG